ncbi:APC family permease [Rhizosaccharibacter radicis]|uniref:APC family permease n=1 Tax=Rhizosaccharibacter radicis TaxID=2782605 RepID=A0ABT1W1J1_9PROT|nr:APC family permease [Acetobacteraceae bacterium KSS12]
MEAASGSTGFRRSLSRLDLTMIGFGSIFGSGWLFAAAHVSAIAGPASLLSWVIAGVAVLLLGLVYCELGAALPQAGGVVRYPEWSHGGMCGFLMGLVTTVAFSSLIAIEIVAARQYAGAWIPGLTRDGAGDPTLAGWLLQLAVLGALFALNRAGIGAFALVNNIVTLFKFCVPALVAIVLLAHARRANFSAHGWAPGGSIGVEAAISSGGIIFAYLGLTPIVSVASEARDPQRSIPFALVASVLLSMAVYVLLQAAFLGSVPEALIAGGWAGLDARLSLPFRDIALLLGAGWLAALVVSDAILSPSGTGNVYMGATPRVIYAWARGGTFFRRFAAVDRRNGVPMPALLLCFALSVFWTLPFPSWQALIGVVSSALMMSYALAPVSAASLRRTAPDLRRPFRVRGFALVAPASFVIASLIVFWTGWPVLRWLLGLQLLGCMLFALSPLGGAGVWRGAFWLLGWLAGLMLLSWLGSFGGLGVLPHPMDDGVVALFSVAVFLAGERGGRPDPMLPRGEMAGEMAGEME